MTKLHPSFEKNTINSRIDESLALCVALKLSYHVFYVETVNHFLILKRWIVKRNKLDFKLKRKTFDSGVLHNLRRDPL
ncbi:hypothetical protein T10_12190 [Trichinella papuae]|uniref:Uncharacterized protein n=1 Tax=Trichinella papuae TaxID=268474 RepID=A0A0V1MKH5_9BILA|nr:hypothetical protein T10_12190 [Trichinella papuae]